MRSRPGAARDYGGVSAQDRRAERRTRLLTAGRQAWGTSGLAGVTVRGVCASAGLTDRYFYEHFANRDELLLAIADEARDQVLAAMVQAGVTAHGTPLERLQTALAAFLNTLADDPHLKRIATADVTGHPELAARRREVLTLITDLLVQHAPPELGAHLDPDGLRRAALFAVGGVNQLIETWLEGSLTLSVHDLATECARMCLAVLNAPDT